jgi:hypothetical protein
MRLRAYRHNIVTVAMALLTLLSITYVIVLKGSGVTFQKCFTIKSFLSETRDALCGQRRGSLKWHFIINGLAGEPKKSPGIDPDQGSGGGGDGFTCAW